MNADETRIQSMRKFSYREDPRPSAAPLSFGPRLRRMLAGRNPMSLFSLLIVLPPHPMSRRENPDIPPRLRTFPGRNPIGGFEEFDHSFSESDESFPQADPSFSPSDLSLRQNLGPIQRWPAPRCARSSRPSLAAGRREGWLEAGRMGAAADAKTIGAHP